MADRQGQVRLQTYMADVMALENEAHRRLRTWGTSVSRAALFRAARYRSGSRFCYGDRLTFPTLRAQNFVSMLSCGTPDTSQEAIELLSFFHLRIVR